MSAKRCDDLRLTGSGGANRVMETELKRLVMRSPYEVRLEIAAARKRADRRRLRPAPHGAAAIEST